MSHHLVNKPTPSTVPLVLLTAERELRKWLRNQSKMVGNWVSALRYKATPGTTCLIPGRDGTLSRVLVGMPETPSCWSLANLPATLPRGRYELEGEYEVERAEALCLGWALGTYRFNRYKKRRLTFAELVVPSSADLGRVSALADAIVLGRDLVNTPAEDMGPQQLADVARALAKQHGAKYQEVVGEQLLKQNYPCIHAVGRASTREPRLVDLTWGNAEHPKVTLVGKGVCFDTGGLDLKRADAMKLMKKDMGGAATVLGVAKAVMSLGLPIRLRVLIPAVENSVSGNAFRPLDVLNTRKGITVEVGNTDAEGRLILCDALAEAGTEEPELLIDVATLTGSARVALGTAMPAVFSSSDQAVDELLRAGLDQEDQLWRLPLFARYRRSLESRVADINNISPGAYGGAITAALFLQEFVPKGIDWMHIDTMAYNLDSQPGRPIGGEVMGLRAIVEMLARRYPAA